MAPAGDLYSVNRVRLRAHVPRNQTGLRIAQGTRYVIATRQQADGMQRPARAWKPVAEIEADVVDGEWLDTHFDPPLRGTAAIRITVEKALDPVGLRAIEVRSLLL